MPSIFTKIINGELPSYKVYENEHVYAFLDINPVQPGHTLIVPKVEVGDYMDVPEPYYSAVFTASQEIGKLLKSRLNCERVGLVVEGFEVTDHFHLKLIPMNKAGDLLTEPKEASNEDLANALDKITN